MNIKLGIIGGSGLYDFEELESKVWIPKEKGPFGYPSDDMLHGIINNVEVFFLPRHGRDHNISPTNIPFKANIDAFKRVGCNDLISVSAVGSLKNSLKPGTFIIVDQFIDRTVAREKSFFDRNIVAHVSMAKPICNETAKLVKNAANKAEISLILGGIYLAIEGPQFSTLAESNLYRDWNCDVIGMTNMPEAKLAREAEIRYVSVAMVTDYDCWHQNESNVEVTDIIKILSKNSNNAKRLIQHFINELSENRNNNIIDGIDNVLDTAIITKKFTKDDLIKNGLDAIAKRIID